MNYVLPVLHRAIAIFTYYEVIMDERIGCFEEITATKRERINGPWLA